MMVSTLLSADLYQKENKSWINNLLSINSDVYSCAAGGSA